MSLFEKSSIRDAKYLLDEDSGQNVLHVDSPHALTQAVGYAKFLAQPFERVLLRGQARLYDTLSPTLYRGIKKAGAQNNRHVSLNKVLELFRSTCNVFSKFPDYSHEPLLQHYGIHTTWIDVVDNVWVALWFASHEAFAAGKNKEFLHFDKRKIMEDSYCYIILLSANDDRRGKPRRGMLLSKKTELIDLRVTVPSIFLRPHSQHGMLFRARGTQDGRIIDYSSSIIGVIRFNLINAFNWLGAGSMVGIRSLFPPPYFDTGYGLLLSVPHSNFSIGSIHHVGA
ncbi:FRG domain-containing protein [Pseudochrobactrum saccharolyticum]|uniref:FRG domain-containing protein n=1 Tax=Pseudochrobactrum saccharolyticum TaxID=354352 RepID=UPI00276E1CD1|nr:FRG domain-containing protein [Pseudochrobactrum saccharolyticum]MDP8249924.1 FRG domain-containing protein [Pseudochrobactrum saccharolyticum]